MTNYIKDCHAIASGLGHNMTWKGIYGHPIKLVSRTVQLICNAIEVGNLALTTSPRLEYIRIRGKPAHLK